MMLEFFCSRLEIYTRNMIIIIIVGGDYIKVPLSRLLVYAHLKLLNHIKKIFFISNFLCYKNKLLLKWKVYNCLVITDVIIIFIFLKLVATFLKYLNNTLCGLNNFTHYFEII